MKEEVVTIGAAKVLRTFVSFTGNGELVSSQIVIASPAANVAVAQFTQEVSKRRSMPIGEHIGEAIRTIKGH